MTDNRGFKEAHDILNRAESLYKEADMNAHDEKYNEALATAIQGIRQMAEVYGFEVDSEDCIIAVNSQNRDHRMQIRNHALVEKKYGFPIILAKTSFILPEVENDADARLYRAVRLRADSLLLDFELDFLPEYKPVSKERQLIYKAVRDKRRDEILAEYQSRAEARLKEMGLDSVVRMSFDNQDNVCGKLEVRAEFYSPYFSKYDIHKELPYNEQLRYGYNYNNFKCEVYFAGSFVGDGISIGTGYLGDNRHDCFRFYDTVLNAERVYTD